MLIVQHYSETKEYVLNLLCRFKKPIDIDNEYATETLRQKQNKDKKTSPIKKQALSDILQKSGHSKCWSSLELFSIPKMFEKKDFILES